MAEWLDAWTAKLDSLDRTQQIVFALMPVAQMAAIVLWLRCYWPMHDKPKSQDAPDLCDLLTGMERVFRRGNSVRAARDFTAQTELEGGDKIEVRKGAVGEVALRDSRTIAVQVTFDGMPPVWVEKSKFKHLALEKKVVAAAGDGATEETPLVAEADKRRSAKVMEAGEAGGDYSAPWTTTFDLTFLIIMLSFLVVLSVLTVFFPFCPEHELQTFFLMQLPKVAVMMVVSWLGGMLARRFCKQDEKGYLDTNPGSWFKVNYTRKIQHFAAYIIPLFMSNGLTNGATRTPSEQMMITAWADWFTLLGFLFLIKPVREMRNPIGTFSMIQFNSLDRPEDRPNTIGWIIWGNILPGLACILAFDWLYQFLGYQKGLTMIFVLVAGVGDGLAEPVGVYLGRHKYKVSSIGAPVEEVPQEDGTVIRMQTKYTRTLEGSACVWWSTLLFVQMYVHCFPTMTPFWIAVAVMPPLMTFGEAYAPHTLDTPVLMGLGGIFLLADIIAVQALSTSSPVPAPPTFF
eukprot:TRINITY_DN56054_c0_g1_i1.p1 TRINITY_DN56054_c0_g1~~TRINITY_DN56054_c0_g1_i1.p1  ORF type:complete len:546 (+),score=130.23 TRINITY_DN56054_c0_g1_i1:94-1638(+)